jgi:hypothetical protein
MNAWDHLAELPIKIESYELTAHDREFGEFTRGSTVVHLRGEGQEGIGEDVIYDVLDHIAHRDAGPVLDLTGPTTLGEVCELLGELDLFGGTPPEREPSRHYRRWAYESAALDLALRQSGLALWEVVERDPQPLRFVCSTRLGGFGEDAPKSSTEPIRKRLSKYPGLEFKLDPENDWDADLIAEIKEIASVQVLDLKGLYRGTPVDVDTDPELYAAAARCSSRTPTASPGTRRFTRSRTSRRWRARRSTPSPRGSDRSKSCSRSTSTARRTESPSTAAARVSSRSAAARSSTWPRSFTPRLPTTARHLASTIRACRREWPPAQWIRPPVRRASAGASGRFDADG